VAAPAIPVPAARPKDNTALVLTVVILAALLLFAVAVVMFFVFRRQ
jgi:hypothetical protein